MTTNSQPITSNKWLLSFFFVSNDHDHDRRYGHDHGEPVTVTHMDTNPNRAAESRIQLQTASLQLNSIKTHQSNSKFHLTATLWNQIGRDGRTGSADLGDRVDQAEKWDWLLRSVVVDRCHQRSAYPLHLDRCVYAIR